MPVAERRAALIAAAERVIVQSGVGEASVRRIVAEAGMSLASFHYAFESREALFEELIGGVVAGEQEALLAEFVVGDGDLRATVDAGFARYLEHLRGKPERELAMLELTWYALRTPEHADLARRQYARYTALAAALLERTAAGLGVRWAEPAEQIAKLLVVFTDGITVGWLVHRDDEAAAFAARAAADTISRMAEPR
ncbi:TetR/AcrR family transcriptional regulator [Agromyces seonyuensis]|nr:TetR family transcriptional regulator [Agromyces seonyuensis]